MRRPASARYPSWTRWRPCTPPEMGFATSWSRPRPVGRPRRPMPSQPTAAADADRRSGVRRPARTRGSAAVGEVYRRVRVCESPGRLAGRVWLCGQSSPPVLVVWVGSPASGWLVFSIFPGKEKSLSALLSCQAANLGSCSCACWHVSSVKYPLVRHVPLSSSSSPWGLRATCNRWWRVRPLLVDYVRVLGCAVRCFRGLLRWRVLVALKRPAFLCGFACNSAGTPATDARHRRPPPTPATDARHRRAPEATTRVGTRGRCPGSFPHAPQNTHGTPRSYLPRNTAVRRF